MSETRVFSFSTDHSIGNTAPKVMLGGKGANLAEMSRIGLPVPPGFTITTQTCAEFTEAGNRLPDGLMTDIRKHVADVENSLGRSYGGERPLLFSVRSGAEVSMPGMMDTVLNLGLNTETVSYLASETGNERFAWDSYRRFITMYADVVCGVDRRTFEAELDKLKQQTGKSKDSDLSAAELQNLIKTMLGVFKSETGEDFPQDPWQQLQSAVEAVFESWNNDRAVAYRRLNRIHGLLGTAVNVQSMVFGNLNENSGTGVAFTRNPSTGENEFFCDVLFNAQGEDVVAGIRTPEDLSALKERMPAVHDELLEIRGKLESHYKDMQDIEFTIQDGKLFMLQTRNGKRTAPAALRIAISMVEDGILTRQEALLRVDANSLNQLLHPMFDPKAETNIVAKGIPASPGAAKGKAVFSPEAAEILERHGEKVVLIREETSPEDIQGMAAAQGILTARGGRTSHAAVVARQMGKPCVAGCGMLEIDERRRRMQVADLVIKEGDIISLNGSTGEVMLGDVPTVQPELSGDFATIMQWSDEFRRLGVRTNADTPKDARKAVEFGAEGIGLCRTEHMFFEEERINKMREMILVSDPDTKKHALDKLLPMQRADFLGLFKEMAGRPVTIRLLDPPLHEFLPHEPELQTIIAKDTGVSLLEIQEAVERMSEVNPMLGLRGCRLGIVEPMIYDMQARAIIEAIYDAQRIDIPVDAEIMIPLVGTVSELARIRKRVEVLVKEFNTDSGAKVEVRIGTMIEVPRAALTADRIAEYADFFSFGTNDLTQMTLGVSRDDAEQSFLTEYVIQGILPTDPFATIDIDGVGKLVEMGTRLGRQTNADLKVGICGEHGGDPESVVFCHNAGLDYVSCSPYRVPIAKLAAAQAAINGDS
ncbi:MAG: pyruvate, phosphate dikinase [Planctomycetota bacterium]|jgi:pyruvate,orthophosphate dikinase